jgi:hypothetical protein
VRLAVISARDVDDATYWRNIAPPLESALADQADTTLIVAPPFRRPTLNANRPAWLSAIRSARRADAVFWIQLHFRPPGPVWSLAYVKPTATRATFVADPWPSIYCHLIAYAKAQRLAHCFLSFRPSVYALKSAAPNRHFEWLPLGFNNHVFRDREVERDIFAISLGRRYEPFHEALEGYCRQRGLRYECIEGGAGTLDELAELTSRSRYFVTLPPDLEDPMRTGGLSPLTLRYLEGPGAGCRPLGKSPPSGEVEVMLPPRAVVECSPDGSDLEAVLDRAEADPDFEAIRLATRDHVHEMHSWERRARWIRARLEGGPEHPLDSIG